MFLLFEVSITIFASVTKIWPTLYVNSCFQMRPIRKHPCKINLILKNKTSLRTPIDVKYLSCIIKNFYPIPAKAICMGANKSIPLLDYSSLYRVFQN